MFPTDTIVAPSTPFGFGGLAVVRMSGDGVIPVAEKLIPRIKTNPLVDRVATTLLIVAPDGDPFDDVVVTLFCAPNSYTGENIIEISCHGSPAIVSSLVSFCVDFGCRLADPGEFTRRAFLNGKLDLIQAESVASLIHSRSLDAAKLNVRLVRGALSNKLTDLRKDLVEALSLVEFELDVSEDEADKDRLEKAYSLLASVLDAFNGLLKTYHDGRILSSGARVVISGVPNVGKSTLLNVLLGKNRAITSDIPGTTRDTIEVNTVVGGIPVCYVDTAGIRNTENVIESDGVNRSVEEIETADLVLRVIDSLSYPVDTTDVKRVIVLNKSDTFLKKELSSFLKKHNDVVSISAINENGIDELESAVLTGLLRKSFHTSDLYLTTSRQNNTIKDCRNNLDRIVSSWKKDTLVADILAFEVRETINGLDFLMGPTSADDVLDKMFNSFCVGK
ncbi:MAG: tRNA uridine-5-carboxymethylaminomethyl(34) synthesis GTPase MnmE [Candidatus Marinimicrobia bacterium]|nr:tRNA uridine-5-carboxymethylaminomethyl(34) synthesis GTPase MnmE [Candidatus Neomarinimicrobiota bacterium]